MKESLERVILPFLPYNTALKRLPNNLNLWYKQRTNTNKRRASMCSVNISKDQRGSLVAEVSENGVSRRAVVPHFHLEGNGKVSIMRTAPIIGIIANVMKRSYDDAEVRKIYTNQVIPEIQAAFR